MQKYSEMSKEQLQAVKKELDQQYAEIKAQGRCPLICHVVNRQLIS